jgi:hypothetical protein
VSRLNGRVKVLERKDRLAAGCRTCGGQPFYIVEPGEGLPSWLDGSSCCRTCGTGVKLIDRACWELL